MVLEIKGSPLQHQMDARPTVYGGESTSHKGLADIRSGGGGVPIVIPPINTDISYTLPEYNPEDHPGLADIADVPEVFDWRNSFSDDTDEIRAKKNLIAKPGNQALCGSCWAISGAGIIGDNYVVSGLVNWQPNLSTTWTLACNPQNQCGGGNPQQLFTDVAKNGITTNHCVDYSWCMEDENCNGSALNHFDTKDKKSHLPTTTQLNKLIPTCGCYYGDSPHYVYQIDDKISQISVKPGDDGNAVSNQATMKRHIYSKGPVLGSFLVFENFMEGKFTKMNGGVYFEKGVYTGSAISFSDDQIAGKNYKGGHAVAVIGWGIEKGIVVDGTGKKGDVPFWYARNSWRDTWGDGGYFKMAMYPWNKTSTFDAAVTLKFTDADGKEESKLSGGSVMISVSKPPVMEKLDSNGDSHSKLLQSQSFYQTDPKYVPSLKAFMSNIDYKDLLWVGIPICVIIVLVWYVKRKRGLVV